MIGGGLDDDSDDNLNGDGNVDGIVDGNEMNGGGNDKKE